jgi:hypothetical protein
MSAFVINPYSFVSEDADAKAYLDAVEAADAQALEAGVRKAVDDFVKGCKADGIWSAIKASCILAGARTLTGALTPLVGSAPTNVFGNFVSGDYNRETGLLGDGSTKSLNANRLANADPTNDCHMAAYVSTIGTRGIMGSLAGPSDHTISSAAHRNRAATATFFTAAIGLIGTSRALSASYVVRNNGSNSTITQASSAAGANDIVVFDTSNTFHGNHRIAYYSIGESIALADLDTRVSTLMTDLAAAI